MLGGVPLALWRLAGWPLPNALPRWSAVGGALSDTEISDAVLLKAAAGVCWLAWLALTAGVLVEGIAWARGRAARRLPLIGPLQVWGGRLVASALLMFSALGGPARPAVAVPVTVPTAPSRAVALDPDRAPAVGARQYVVQPPEGRRRDTLWGIAERHLGNPQRWPEIFELNRGRVSAGHRLTDPHWIYPGEVLLMPDDAIGVNEPQEARPARIDPPVPAAAPAPELPTARQEPGRGSFVPPVRHEPVPAPAADATSTMGHELDSPAGG